LESSRWSFEEIQYLIDNYHIKTQAEIVLFLGRSHTSVSHKAARLGVRLTNSEIQRRAYIGNSKREINGDKNPNWKGGVSQHAYRYKLRQIAKFPERVKARELVGAAIRSGKIKRLPCIVCGSCDSHAHHEDYSRPYDVIWLCRKHHNEEHNRGRSDDSPRDVKFM